MHLSTSLGTRLILASILIKGYCSLLEVKLRYSVSNGAQHAVTITREGYVPLLVHSTAQIGELHVQVYDTCHVVYDFLGA